MFVWQARTILEAAGALEENESLVHLAWPEALSACGRDDEARPFAEAAAARLCATAAKFSSPARREAYLHAIDTHARTLQLAHRLGVSVSLR